MPIYVYQSIDINHGCDHCKNSFEILQSFSESITECPECHAPIHKVIQKTGVRVGKKHLLTDKSLKEHGFSKLVNEGEGKFRQI